ncbi:flippase [Acidithiobacillus caldus]|jgi:PST family polysaccharide transporter|nr:flippase [Acidithiobacillus caldus]
MASLFTLQGANYVLPLVTLPYLVRVLGPEKFGLIAFAQAFTQYFVVATDYGFNLSATRDVAIHRDDPQKLAEIVAAVMTIKIILALSGAFVLTYFVSLVPSFREHGILYAVAYLAVIGSTIFPVWLFQGLERMRYIARLLIAARLLTTVAIFMLVQNSDDYIIAAAIQSIPFLVAAIPAWALLHRWKTYKFKIPSLFELRKQLTNGWPVFLSTAAISIYTSSNTVILGLLTNASEVGYYSFANKISGAILGLYQPINQTVYPHISKLNTRSRKKAVEFIKMFRYKYIFFGAFTSLLVYGLSHQIVMNVGGARYAESVIILQILAILPFCLSFGHIYGGLTMLPLGLNGAFSRIVIASMVTDLVLIYPLIRIFGAAGAAVDTVIAEIIVSSFTFYYVKTRKVLSEGLMPA